MACYISVPSRVSLSIGDWRILHLLRIILQLNFNEVRLFFIQTNQTWIRYVTLKRNYSQKCVILVLSHLLYIPKEITIIHKRSHLNASSFKPNKTDRGCVKYLTVCWRVDCWLYAQRFFILHAENIKRINTMKQNVKQNKVHDEQIIVAKLRQENF